MYIFYINVYPHNFTCVTNVYLLCSSINVLSQRETIYLAIVVNYIPIYKGKHSRWLVTSLHIMAHTILLPTLMKPQLPTNEYIAIQSRAITDGCICRCSFDFIDRTFWCRELRKRKSHIPLVRERCDFPSVQQEQDTEV